MKIAVLDDYQDAFRRLRCYPRLEGHEVTVFHDTEKDARKLAARLQGFDALIMTQQRCALRQPEPLLTTGRPADTLRRASELSRKAHAP